MFRKIRKPIGFLFGPTAPVSRRAYVVAGTCLAVAKAVGDLLIAFSTEGVIWTLPQLFFPALSQRFYMLSAPASWLLLGLWTLPFLWIGIAMTARRAVDAKLPASLSLLFLIPWINYAVIGLLCLLPTSSAQRGKNLADDTAVRGGLSAAVISGALFGLAMVGMAVISFERYGLALFIAAPLAVGFVTAIGLNWVRSQSRGASHRAAQLALALTAALLLGLALEGILCLTMAWPLAALIAVVGVELGLMCRPVRHLPAASFVGILVLLPLTTAIDNALPHDTAPERSVVSEVVVAAPPEIVWRYVIAFPELPPPRRLAFKAGIAYPLHARIDGSGVGAVRYCVFSTGAFVEPITTWDPPRALAFDVVRQPPTLQELSPWPLLEPPHVSSSMRTSRGRFDLVPLSDGRTKLIGTTWYRLELYPQLYWTRWSDFLIHAIHLRVLGHIRTLAEQETATEAQLTTTNHLQAR